MTNPNFFLVGGPRCGSTFLYHYIEQHPDIFFSARKETHFFSQDFQAECDELHGQRGREMTIFSIRDKQDYLGQYADTEGASVVGDASTSHLYSKVAAELIAEFNPDARILISLRNPIDQMRSWHAYLVRHREELLADFGEALEANRTGTALGKHSDALRHATRIDYRYITDYGQHLERFRQYFPAEQIHVVVFDDFMLNPAQEFRRIFEFLDVDADVADTLNYEQRNSNKQLMFAGMFRHLTDRGSPVRRLGDAVLPRGLARSLHSGLIQLFTSSRARSSGNRDAIAALQTELLPRVERLGEMVDRDLVSLWGYRDH